ncbi:MAG: HIT family protein [Caulobacterales bacterium]|nr:HIT family protein [Caulobacterales bacterium]
MSLTGTYDPDNVFARILRGELPAVKVFEDDRILAFMDVFPQSEGHVLVISKVSQARNLIEAEPEIVAELAQATQRIAAAMPAALGCEGVSIMQFNGAAGGQTVFHLHFHAIPRWSDRTVGQHGEGQMADIDDLQTAARKIADRL